MEIKNTSEFETYSEKLDNKKSWRYIYYNKHVRDVEYIPIWTCGTAWLYSLVTFKPANIPDAPVMVVDTYKKEAHIYLPRSVDEWEIKYYSNSDPLSHPDPDYLKNAGVVNLNETFRCYIKDGLILELSWGTYIERRNSPFPRYSIPDVLSSCTDYIPSLKDLFSLIGRLV